MQAILYIPTQIDMDQEATERVERAKREGLCVACMAPHDGPQVRGCHMRCYVATRRAIASGHTTERKRVLAGRLLPRANFGPRPTNPVTVECRKDAS